MSNYPPGVTGREPQIAGLAGGVSNVSCEKPATLTVTDDDGKAWPIEIDECPYEGDTDVQYGGTRKAPIRYWTCPLCGHEHEDELSDD